jgi:hypothetical protein
VEEDKSTCGFAIKLINFLIESAEKVKCKAIACRDRNGCPSILPHQRRNSLHPGNWWKIFGRFEGPDSLGYLSINAVKQAIDIPEHNLCFACSNGNYPVPID